MGRFRRSLKSKSLLAVARSKSGLAKRSSLEVKVLRILLAVTGAKSIISDSARTQLGDKANQPGCRPSMIRFQWCAKPSVFDAIPCLKTSPNVEGNEGVSRTYMVTPKKYERAPADQKGSVPGTSG